MEQFIYIPIFILMWLPESIQIQYAKIVWSRKSDAHILYAYENHNEWKTVGVDSITRDAEEKLQKYILPEMSRRGLDGPPLRSLWSRANEHLIDIYLRNYPNIKF